MGFISNILNSYAGMYAVQVMLHSLVAGALAASASLAWDLKAPRARQRLHMCVILVPATGFPLYQMISPERGSVYFRLDALLDANRWLVLNMLGMVPVLGLVGLVVLLSTLIFLSQELMPIFRHMIDKADVSHNPESIPIRPDSPAPTPHMAKVRLAAEGLPVALPEIYAIEHEEACAFSSTGARPAIYLSIGLVDALDTDALRAAIAHEAAHIMRSRSPVIIMVFILRVLMFFNPVTLLEFRRMVQEEERICDEIAAGMTGSPGALASALEAMRPDTGEHAEGVTGAVYGIEQYSLSVQLNDRITWLRSGGTGNAEPGWAIAVIVALAAMAINYYVV